MIKKKTWIIMMLLFATLILSVGAVSAQEQDTAKQEEDNKTLLILGCAIAVGMSGISAATGLAIS